VQCVFINKVMCFSTWCSYSF